MYLFERRVDGRSVRATERDRPGLVAEIEGVLLLLVLVEAQLLEKMTAQRAGRHQLLHVVQLRLIVEQTIVVSALELVVENRRLLFSELVELSSSAC